MLSTSCAEAKERGGKQTFVFWEESDLYDVVHSSFYTHMRSSSVFPALYVTSTPLTVASKSSTIYFFGLT